MDDLMEALAEIDAGLERAIEAVHNTLRLADRYGGEVSTVMTGHLYNYLLGNLDRLRHDEQQPGSVAVLRAFLIEMRETGKVRRFPVPAPLCKARLDPKLGWRDSNRCSAPVTHRVFNRGGEYVIVPASRKVLASRYYGWRFCLQHAQQCLDILERGENPGCYL